MNSGKKLIIAAIYLHGEKLDPAYVTKLIGVSPSRAHAKGDVSHTSTGKEVVAKSGLWSLSTSIVSDHISAHISALSETLSNFHGRMGEIRGVDRYYLDIFVAEDADSDGGGSSEFVLTVEDVDNLKMLNLPINMKIEIVVE